MWSHNYTPVAGSLALSSLAAAIPIFVLLFLLGVKRTPAWIAGLFGLAAAAVVAVAVYGMPVANLFGAATYGAANGLFPIGWVVFTRRLNALSGRQSCCYDQKRKSRVEIHLLAQLI